MTRSNPFAPSTPTPIATLSRKRIRERLRLLHGGFIEGLRAEPETKAFEQSQHALAAGREQVFDLVIGRVFAKLRGGVGWVGSEEHSIEGENVEVDVEIQGRPKALRHDKGSPELRIKISAPGALPIEAHQRAHDDFPHGRAQLWIETDAIAQCEGNGEDELAQREVGKHVFGQVGFGLDHAAHPARRAEAAALAGERQDLLPAASIAADAQEAPVRNSAIEKGAQFALDEERESAVRGAIAGREKRRKVMLEYPVER